jgi:hypothetical protein
MLLGSHRPTVSTLACLLVATTVVALPYTGRGAVRAVAARRVQAARTVRLVTFNVDKNLDSGHSHDWDLFKKKADVVFFQETTRLRVRTLAGGGTWVVRQGASGSKRSEVALAVRRSVLHGGLSSTVSGFRVIRVLCAIAAAGRGRGSARASWPRPWSS